MSRYKSSYNGRLGYRPELSQSGVPKSWYTAGPKPRKPGTGLRGADAELYDWLHLCWSAGVVSGDWGLFAPEPGLEPEWWLDGRVFAHAERDIVRGVLATLMFGKGIAALEWGPSWVGRRSVVVSYVQEVAA